MACERCGSLVVCVSRFFFPLPSTLDGRCRCGGRQTIVTKALRRCRRDAAGRSRVGYFRRGAQTEAPTSHRESRPQAGSPFTRNPSRALNFKLQHSGLEVCTPYRWTYISYIPSPTLDAFKLPLCLRADHWRGDDARVSTLQVDSIALFVLSPLAVPFPHPERSQPICVPRSPDNIRSLRIRNL